MKPKIQTGLTLGLLMALAGIGLLMAKPAQAYHYMTAAKVNMRSGPGLNHGITGRLEQNQSVRVLSQSNGWSKLRTLSGQEGYAKSDFVSSIWIKVHKKERRVFLMQGDKVVQSHPAAFCPFNPLGDKLRQGDGGTPEGRFYLCEMIKEPGQAKYGARSMRISYPNIEDARRGLAGGLIDYQTYLSIVRAVKSGKMPPQNTALGGSIRIHGGGAGSHWTLGCVGMNDADIKKLYDHAAGGMRVEIYKSAEHDRELNRPGYVSRMILKGAKAQLKKPALYTRKAAAGGRLSYPLGDISKNEAVCTDIVIRALRRAGIDLQAVLHEDIITNPERYSRRIKRPDYHIDHRRARNLQIYLEHKTRPLHKMLADSAQESYRPGDIVTMDTGIPNGTAYDHIGIVGDSKNPQGRYMVINIWTMGMHTSSMDLLAGDYPKIVGHFRAGHPFDYQN